MGPVSSRSPVPPFASLHHRNFRLLWIGQLISQAGSLMQIVGMNWHIYLLTGSPVALGLISVMRFVPIAVFSLIGGVYADTHNRRKVLLVTQSWMMLFAAMLGLLTNLRLISTGLIYLFAGLASTAMAFDGPARQALIPNLVPQAQLTNALSLNNVTRKIATIVGPGFAGFVIAWKGVGGVYWINAASFLAVLVALLAMRIPARKDLVFPELRLSALTEGISFMRYSRILFSMILLDFLGTFFSSASVLLPIFAQEILNVGPKGLGMLYAAESFGAVVVGALMSWAGDVKKKGAMILWSLGAYGAATILYGISKSFVLSLLFLALVGAADTLSTILRNTLRQLITPDHLRGRMTSINMIFARGGPQLGNLEAGLVAAWIGAPLSVVTGGIATVIATAIVAWRVPQLRNYGD
jgi:MFS family permease